MPSTGKNDPKGQLKDKVRSLFDPRDPQKKKDALPPKAHFSIWMNIKSVTPAIMRVNS